MTSMNIVEKITNRIDDINYHAKVGYVTKHHKLYPDSFLVSASNFTVGGTLVPALNIMKKSTFDKLMNDNETDHIYKIGTLDFYDEMVEFFGSFGHHDALYTKLNLNELASYDLPECFLDTVRVFKNPEDNKYHHDSLNCGNPLTTVIVVLGNDEISLYRHK